MATIRVKQQALNLDEARAKIAGMLDNTAPADIGSAYVKFHMNKAAQVAICGRYVGRMRFTVNVRNGWLVWVARANRCVSAPITKPSRTAACRMTICTRAALDAMAHSWVTPRSRRLTRWPKSQ